MGLLPASIGGIVVTHEHDDHLGGVFKFSRRFGTPVYLTHGTWRAALRSQLTKPDYLQTGRVHLVETDQPFELAGLQLHPFPVPHDAAEPVQLLLSESHFTVGLLTDCGSSTPYLVSMLQQADALVLESNHCPEKLMQSPYPPSLKRRVGGNYGHLSNDVACSILKALVPGRLKHAVAAHLSQNTNCPELVARLWGEVLHPQGVTFDIACQLQGIDWLDLKNAVQQAGKAA
ncbi:MAG: MBL fold metallo-hydrolase [Limnobacter sp.]|nr:MBL fold metallo-hydrolase [Limnobacter sp.]